MAPQGPGRPPAGKVDETQRDSWLTLVADPVKLAQVVSELRRLGLELGEDGIIRLRDYR